MDKNNIGFRQYKLSEDFSMNVAVGQEIINHGFEVNEQYPLTNVVDGNEDTYCELNGSIGDSLVINFKKNIHANYIKIIFHNTVRQVSVFNQNGQLIFRKAAYSDSFSIAEGELDEDISSITLTFNPVVSSSIIEVSSIELFSNNTIVPPIGYYIKDFEIQSEKLKGGEDNDNN